jgi:hypothetical protein
MRLSCSSHLGPVRGDIWSPQCSRRYMLLFQPQALQTQIKYQDFRLQRHNELQHTWFSVLLSLSKPLRSLNHRLYSKIFCRRASDVDGSSVSCTMACISMVNLYMVASMDATSSLRYLTFSNIENSASPKIFGEFDVNTRCSFIDTTSV